MKFRRRSHADKWVRTIGSDTQTGRGVNLLSQSGAGVGRAGGVDSGSSLGQGVPSGSLMSTRPSSSLPGSLGVAAALVGRDFIEAEDTDENHAHNRGGKKKGLPTGLKGNTLHVRLPALRPRT